MKILTIVAVLTFSLTAMANQDLFKEKPDYLKYTRQSIVANTCDNECIKLALAAASTNTYHCEVDPKNRQNYDWLNKIGVWAGGEYDFSYNSGNYISWLAALFIVENETQKDHQDIILSIESVTAKARLEVKERCLAVGGKIRW